MRAETNLDYTMIRRGQDAPPDSHAQQTGDGAVAEAPTGQPAMTMTACCAIDGTVLRTAFHDGQDEIVLKWTAAVEGLEEVLRLAEEDAAQLFAVGRWMAAETELTASLVDFDRACTQLARATAEREALAAEGTGDDIARRLRDLDSQIEELRSDRAAAYSVFDRAWENAADRRARAEKAVRDACRRATAVYCRRARERVIDMIRKLCASSHEIPSALAASAALAKAAVAPMDVVVDSGVVEIVITRLLQRAEPLAADGDDW